ncbi:MAG: cation:proton antiporter [Planctomycetota bacterium]
MELLLYLALVPALGVTAQWLAWRTRLPGILLLLIFGILLGQFVQVDVFFAELTGGDEGAGPNLLFPIVSLSVAVIMFEGGLSLRLRELRESGSASLRLVTLGALFTFVGNAAAAIWILGFPWRISLLLGAILVVTGPTVIGPLLRQVRPSKRVAATLKWEGIVIDPWVPCWRYWSTKSWFIPTHPPWRVSPARWFGPPRSA